MLNRRLFLASSIAASSLGLTPTLAHKTKKKYTLPAQFIPREVWLKTRASPGEIHIYPDEFALYWTLSSSRAIRYTVGIGRKNLYHAGTFFVGAKKIWPSWTPTPDMIKRQPHKYARFAGGMPGGINNPLGARALYLFTTKRGDTFLRIHGTNDPRTIGIEVSNGCARLINEQVAEFYDRIPLGTPVVLHKKARYSREHS